MKHFGKLSVLAVAAFAAVLAVYSYAKNDDKEKQKTDKDGHVLISLWKEYDKADKADLPQKEEQILDDIIMEAKSGGYVLDFYDGCRKWYDAVVSRDWKRRDEAGRRVADDAADFDNALVSYRLADDGIIRNLLDAGWYDRCVSAGRQSLVQSRTPVLYSSDGNLTDLPGFVLDNISNDYEYLLWSLSCTSKYYSSAFTELVRPMAENDLAEYLGDSYPAGAYLEFRGLRGSIFQITGFSETEAALKAFVEKYDGKAIALLAFQEILAGRKSELDWRLGGDRSKPEPADYISLRDDCGKFERLRKSFSGKEAEIADYCTGVAGLVESLDSKWIAAGMSRTADNEVAVLLRNIDEVEARLHKGQKDGEVLHSAVLKNNRGSYYIQDTVTYVLPENLDDGDYCIELSGKGAETMYFSLSRNTISLASRKNADGLGIYAADYRTGEPVSRADLKFLYKGNTVETVNGFEFDGFTSVQEYLDGISASGIVVLKCSYTDERGIYRESGELVADSGRKTMEASGQSQFFCTVISDRAAYNPGETVKFKAVMYSVSGKEYAVLPEGVEVSAAIYGSDRKVLGSLDLVTNDFGAAAGEFVLPGDVRGGRFMIEVKGEYVTGTAWITVDEFVLPTYTLEFDKDTSLYYNGDTIVVRGSLASYSGHPVSAAKLSYNVHSWTSGEVAGEIEPLPGGRFEFSFMTSGEARQSAWYNVKVKAVDQTGETLEWSTSYRTEPYIMLDLRLVNKADAYVSLGSLYGSQPMPASGRDRNSAASAVLDGEIAHFTADVYANVQSGNVAIPADIHYKVQKDGETFAEGNTAAGKGLDVDLSGKPSGIYVLDAEAVYVSPGGERTVLGYTYTILKISENDSAVYSDVDFFCRRYDDGRIAVQLGTTSGPEWVVVELYGDESRLLRSEMVFLTGARGKGGSVRLVEYDYRDEYPDNVRVQLFSFKNGTSRSNSYVFSRKDVAESGLPLEFCSFTDKSSPREECVFGIRTLPGVECAVSVFDISTETIAGNVWRAVRKSAAGPAVVPISSACGSVRGFGGGIVVRGRYAGANLMAKSAVTEESMGVEVMDYVETDSSFSHESDSGAGAEEEAAVPWPDENLQIRDRFENTLAFMPFLRSGDDGNLTVKVNSSDKLSTYCVQVFAHNREMDNAVLRRDFIVTRSVKVSVVPPQFLYGGDVYRLKASVSNGSDEGLEGTLYLYIYDTEDYLSAQPVVVDSMQLAVGGGDSVPGEFEVDVPVPADGRGVLGFKVIYAVEQEGLAVSDGIFVTVPVMAPVQTLVEAHSAVLRPGMDRDSLRRAVAAEFTGTLGQTYDYREISLMDMLLDAVPGKIEPKSDDVLSLTEAYYAGVMADMMQRLSPHGASGDGVSNAGMDAGSIAAHLSDLAVKIVACQNADGGFAWFNGFRSSPVLTAVVAERLAVLHGMLTEYCRQDSGCELLKPLLNTMPDAVKYLDGQMFQPGMPSWCGGISLGQYLYLRSMYPDVPFAPDADRKALAEFRKNVKEYLVPSRQDALDGYILGKARRIATALNMSESAALASMAGVSRRKLMKTVEEDMVSLFEYSVSHYSGGTYYPNAVMPFRGLLENEVYAHSLICDLMSRYSGICRTSSRKGAEADAARSGAIADGIRLWLMLQKETQRWDSDSAYMNAVNSVLNGSDELKNTSVIVLTKKYMKSFREISAAGNGFTVVRTFYRGKAVDEKDESGATGRSALTEIKDGDVLCTGDRIIAEYKVWSAENRSFVLLSAPRPASLRPVQQLSGNAGGWARPLPASGSYMVTPYAYREVKSDRTDWYLDVCPEEYTVITEEFFVTQSGRFIAPVVSIESLYAPHYRANDMSGGVIAVE